MITVIYEDGSSCDVDVDVIVLPDYVKQTGDNKPDVPDNYVKVVFKPTEKATDSSDIIYWVNPKNEVKLPIDKPQGKKDVVVDGRKTDYVFKEWRSEADDKVFDATSKQRFTENASFVAKYTKVIDAGIITPVPNIESEGITVSESLKDGENWINKFIPSQSDIESSIKIKTEDGKLKGLPDGAKVEFGEGDADTWKKYDDLEKALYEKLKEKNDGNKPNREEKIKARVTIDGISKIVEIPIKVNKNIYEATTSQGKPDYVPDEYVKVAVDPTKDAQDTQKTYYYVNPKAMVNIPGKDPTAVDGKVFTGWVLKEGSKDETPYSLKDRHKFTEKENTIKALFVSDVVEQNGKDKPNVPEYYVKVIVDYTAKAKLSVGEKEVRTFWVNPNKKVKILDNNPTAIQNWTFEKWMTDGNEISLTESNKFTAKETKVKAVYSYGMTPIEPLDPKGDAVVTYVGKTPDTEDYLKKLEVPKGKTIGSIKINKKPDVSKPGKSKAEIEITYTDGSGTITEIDVIVKDNVYPTDGNGNRTKDTPDYYVKVVVDPKDKAKDPRKTVYYVNPKVEVGLQINTPKGRKHWNFVKWKVNDTEFNVGAKHKFEQNTTIHAVWNNDPILKVKNITVKKGSSVNLRNMIVKAYDREDGNLISDVKIVSTGGFNKNKPGKYEIRFKVTDKNGAVIEARAYVTVSSKPESSQGSNNKPQGKNPASQGQTGGNSPATGDSMPYEYAYLSLFSLALLLVAVGRKRKKDDCE